MKRYLSEVIMRRSTEIEDYLNLRHPIDPKVRPISLLKELHSKEGLNSFIRRVNKKHNEGSKVLHKLILVHLCLIYDPSLCQGFKLINFRNLSADEWLNSNLLQPYNFFLERICYSQEVYATMRLEHIVVFDFQKLFTARNLLKYLFVVVKKIDGLEMYYDHEKKKKTNVVLEWKHINEFISVLAYHAQEIYAIFKAILGEMIRFPAQYLDSVQKIKIIKYILRKELDQVNEEMKALFLNRNFQPISKGYGVKLLRVEELSEQTRKYVHQIAYAKKKHKRKASVDSFFFDKSGRVSESLIQGLRQITRSINQDPVSKMRGRRGISQQIETI